ncbi:dynamin-related protein 3A, partial [Trifolium medium]|nr:dynamin-related protein 3A [Trifolium medium]
MEAETLERGYNLPERSGLPKIHGLPTSSMYSTSSSGEYYGASPKHP